MKPEIIRRPSTERITIGRDPVLTLFVLEGIRRRNERVSLWKRIHNILLTI